MECEKVILEYFHLLSMQWEKYILTVFIPVDSSFSLIGIGGGATNTVGLISVLWKHQLRYCALSVSFGSSESLIKCVLGVLAELPAQGPAGGGEEFI